MRLGTSTESLSQRGPSDSSEIYLWLTNSDEDFAATSGLGDMPVEAAKSLLINDDKLLGTFGPPIKELVAAGCDEISADEPEASLDTRALYKLPHGTLLGAPSRRYPGR